MAAPTSLVGGKRLAVGPQDPRYALPTNIGTMPGSTDYGVLGANSGSYGQTPNGSGSEYTDAYGKKFRYVDYGNGSGEWLQVTPGGALVKPQDAAAAQQRDPWAPTPGASIQGTRSAGNSGSAGGTFFTPAGGSAPRSVQMGGTRFPIPTADQEAAQQFGDVGFNGAATLENDWKAINDPWQQAIGGATAASVAGRNGAVSKQQADTQSYLAELQRLQQQQTGFVNTANAADQQALGDYNSRMAPIISDVQGLQAPSWVDYNSNPQDIARQTQSYDWLNGVAGGSLDYQAAQAGLTNADYQRAGYQTAGYRESQLKLADYQRADYQRAQLFQAALEKYASNPDDIQGQKDAIAAIKGDLAHGGDDQREAMNRYKALTSPEVTAQERYLAEIARRSFESQDRSNREAQMQELANRGLRSGGAEIAGNLANQERLGQDRTLAELGLQANAVGRSMNALAGYSQSASNLRSADLQAMGLYVDATGQLRSMNDQVGMFNTDQANTVGMYNAGQANQNSQFNANAYNTNSMFNANAYNTNSMFNTQQTNYNNQFNANEYNRNQQFNADANNRNQEFNANAYNTNSMFNAGQANAQSAFNAGQTNIARANNQGVRLTGGVQAAQQANSIRQNNDVIGMFNTQGSQSSQLAAAQFGLEKGRTLGGFAQQSFGNTTGVNDAAFGRNSGLTAQGIGSANAGFGANTTTNGIVANAGSQNLNDILAGFGGAQSGFNTGAPLSMSATAARQGGIALNAAVAKKRLA